MEQQLSSFESSLLRVLIFSVVKRACIAKKQNLDRKLHNLWLTKHKSLPNGVTNMSSVKLKLEEKYFLSRGLKFGILPKKLDEMLSYTNTSLKTFFAKAFRFNRKPFSMQ